MLVPLCTEFNGGWSKSQYCNNASRRDRDTSAEAVVVQSTRYGYNPINCFHAMVPTKINKTKSIKRTFS